MIHVVFLPPCVAAGQRADQARQHVHAAAAAHALNAGLQHGRRDRQSQRRRLPPQGTGEGHWCFGCWLVWLVCHNSLLVEEYELPHYE